MCSATADCANPSRPQPDGKKIDAATAMHLQKLDDIKALIAAEDFAALKGNDELAREISQGAVFANFKDAVRFDGSVWALAPLNARALYL